MARPGDYMVRKSVNEKSKAAADHDKELWSADETELLMEGEGEEDLIALAELLGRTVEACRQKRYEVKRSALKQVAEKKVQRLDRWSWGFTSLDEMGY